MDIYIAGGKHTMSTTKKAPRFAIFFQPNGVPYCFDTEEEAFDFANRYCDKNPVRDEVVIRDGETGQEWTRPSTQPSWRR